MGASALHHDKGLKVTAVASCKVRVGPFQDDEKDYAFPSWAGVIPILTQVLPPESDPRNLPGVGMPEDILKFRLG